MLFTAIVAILAVTLLILHLGRAGDLRTRTQTAADASALAAAGAIRDAALAHYAEGLMPYGTRYESAPVAVWDRAREYAERNGAVLDDLRPSGAGRTVTVTVHSQEAQGGSLPGSARHARARATATVFFPGDCYQRDAGNWSADDQASRGREREVETGPVTVWCNDRPVADEGRFAAGFEVRLVAGPGRVLDVGGIPSGGVSSVANRELGRRMAAGRGWIGRQWACLDQLWQRESGWNHLAVNPRSGAYGIPQALPGDKMRTAGGDWRSDPRTQIAWGLDYIGARYGTPCDAWGFWQRVDPRPYPGHWY